MTDLHCPNCGHAVHPSIATIRLTTCESCGTSLLLDDAAARLAGQQGVVHNAPALMGLGDTVTLGNTEVHLLGHAQFSYGRGYWDEFFGLDSNGKPVWVSVDEGDVVLQRALTARDVPTLVGTLRIGAEIHTSDELYRITELDDAECTGLRGEFDEVLKVGETYRFVNALSDYGDLLSGEFQNSYVTWFLGTWHDPFDIKVSRTA